MSDDILIHREAGVTTLTFNRPARKNSITGAMYQSLAQALEAAQAADDTRVVVLQGHETVFSAGNDIEDFMQRPPTAADAPVFRFLQALANFPKPLLAAVCGPAVGIGTTMLLHCDLVYAGDNAAFSLPFVNLGLVPEAASSLLVPQLMGHQRAAEALLLGEPFMAEAALEVGLVNRVVPPSEANALAQAQARKLAAKPSVPLRETKRLMKQARQALVLQHMQDEAAIFARMLTEPAAREAFGAFMDKRRPDFSKL
ncbi:enoyl-CoA hydratase [Ramlibacter sp. AW1]|uniref:Enoyl-CoA hydratase n=1 Tax=Ramlibacter aurantiacus TaxID=2801330 RepID=A0A936ZL76_9BURK|nr:enoyl-CoA hydratase [Ramlibacter aurantiacus]MBL0422248.1 enoyl-CoA hydratase [Ramlibacter aurantiacus]